MKYLFKNGVPVSSAGCFQADLLIQGEKIAQIGQELSVEDAQEIDVFSKYIFPGFIDAHTHFDLDADDFATGTKAALAGGTTAILDFTTQEKGETSKMPWITGTDWRRGKPAATTDFICPSLTGIQP